MLALRRRKEPYLIQPGEHLQTEPEVLGETHLNHLHIR